MTRETKIGLLMGLGFIVVFAVLLLQTGNRPPSGDLQMMLSRHGNSATSRPDTLARLPERTVSGGPATSPAVSTAERVAESLTYATEPWSRGLPTPSVFDARPDSRDLGPGGSELTETLTPEPQAGADVPTIAPVRVAPTDGAEPSIRPDSPKTSPEPGPSATPPEIRPSQTPPSLTPDRFPAEADVTAPATYVVQRGDSLMRIARKHYNDESTAVVDFLLRSNSDKVRDRHFVLAGQTLVIPVLPANLRSSTTENNATASRGPVHMEEAASPADLHGNAGLRPLKAERVVPPLHVLVGADEEARDAEVVKTRSDSASDAAASPRDLRNGNNRDSSRSGARDKAASDQGNKLKAPEGAKRSTSKDKPGDGAYRWYTIRPKDTLSQIADKELGGSAGWQEIIKLNKNINPTRLKAGDKIRLPNKRKPASDSSKRSST